MNTLLSRLPEPITRFFSRLRQRPVLTSIAAIALTLALAVGITGAVLGGDGDDSGAVVNEAGGYRLMAPDGWKVSQQGPTTKLTSPGKQAVVSVGTGNPGALQDAGALFFQQVGRHYENPKLTGVEGKQIGSRPALVYGGLGINDEKVKIKFLAITVQGKPRNYAISVFTAADSDPQQVLPKVNSVVGSFRPLEQP
jgi:hypothetical protein